jgi:hypothetical protein
MMITLQGCDLQLEVDEVLEAEASLLLHLFAGHTPLGERYLVLHSAGDGDGATWMCAPISERALACVRTGRADLHAAFAHTATGTVDIVRVEADGHCTESLRLCHELRDEDLPPIGSHLRICA